MGQAQDVSVNVVGTMQRGASLLAMTKTLNQQR
eukprot:COSAG01_NODE_31398_length_598_cov_1.332665_2_plen_32_part_01